ncbi:MAG: aminopeptidase [Deltaproteobacteria bacterium]|nr:aminopeptidase [Deltaproteobacteria bacterium]
MLIFSVIPGCKPGYVIDAGLGQWRLLNGSRPLEELKKEGALTKEELSTADLILDIKRFGESELGLKKTANYQDMYVGASLSHIYVLAASPKDRLQLETWWFPIIGRIPYLGFFDEQDALDEQGELDAQGLDTYLRTSTAYSTLGWFQDPIVPDMMNHRPARIAEIVLHELTHTTIYEKGQTAFNEGLAVLVGVIGAEMYCTSRWGAGDPETAFAAGAVHDQKLFSDFLGRFLDRLSSGYLEARSPEDILDIRTRMFQLGNEEFRALSSQLKTDRFSSFYQWSLNNAYLSTLALYFRSYSDFEALYRTCGNDLKTTLALCKSLGSSWTGEDLMQKVRKQVEDRSRSTLRPGAR